MNCEQLKSQTRGGGGGSPGTSVYFHVHLPTLPTPSSPFFFQLHTYDTHLRTSEVRQLHISYIDFFSRVLRFTHFSHRYNY